MPRHSQREELMPEKQDDKPQTMVQRQVVERTVVRETVEEPPGPNASTEPEDPEGHYFLAPDGETKINAWGEKKGSPEDKKRW
jgi:hypothetical protein